MLLIHIITALVSLTFSTLTAVTPTNKKIKVSYLLAFLTILSGGAITIISNIPLQSVCVTGGFYTTYVIASIILARRRLSLYGSRISY